MGIDDYKDTVELDNVTRKFLDRLKAMMQEYDQDPKSLDDTTVLRFAVAVTLGMSVAPPNEAITEVMGHALAIVKMDPAEVELALFRDGSNSYE